METECKFCDTLIKAIANIECEGVDMQQFCDYLEGQIELFRVTYKAAKVDSSECVNDIVAAGNIIKSIYSKQKEMKDEISKLLNDLTDIYSKII